MAIHTFTGSPHEWNKLPAERDESKVTWDVTYEGCVLQTFERNGWDDSDFYAIVWDEAEQCIKDICYATTRGWTYANHAVVDATPEVIAKAQAYLHAGHVRRAHEQNQAQARRPAVGREVRFRPTVNGRNRRCKRAPEGVLPAGDIAYVAGLTEGMSGPQAIVQYQGKHLLYVSIDAIEVVDPEQYLTDDDVVEARVTAPERITNFHRPVPGYISMVA